MVLVLVAIIFLALCGGLVKSFPARLAMEAGPGERVFQKGLSSDSVNEVYDSYYAISKKNEENEETNVIARVQRVDLNKIKYSHIYDINGDTYILVKAFRHRNKRFTSYHTLCPFKICNMGRKRTRTRRYIEPIRPVGDNDET
ncbi:uncharacterized protein LOC108911628 [Anoplophora glabripennis]|uniref:uncharacterized protein LOC108911628 n=1 Tax=Anoplophora glabripennis TaxID=217634 RepID=UPI000874ED2D|nr:uncharacterized protein LOC108911628 [Anoplophora glabripennis]